ncbi:MAG: VanZ family protein [Dehalococcoidia bacterium]
MDRPALRRLAQVATAFSAAIILYATLTPSPENPSGMPDWAAHLVLFTALGAAAALWYATSDAARRGPRRALFMVVLALWLFGGLTELAQGRVEGRTMALSDLGFDVLGAVLGFIGGSVLWRMLLARLGR